MLKAADVHMISYEKIGSGLCTAIIQGAGRCRGSGGMQQALQIGELNAAVIPRPLDDLEQNLPSGQLLNRRATQTLVDVKNQEKGRGSCYH